MTNTQTAPDIGDFEDPLFDLQGIAGALTLMGESELLGEDAQPGVAWISDHLARVTASLVAIFEDVHATIKEKPHSADAEVPAASERDRAEQTLRQMFALSATGRAVVLDVIERFRQVGDPDAEAMSAAVRENFDSRQPAQRGTK